MKTAIILSGGGMMAAYCVGALLELDDRGVRPDILIAGSGSAGTGSYYVASQPKSIIHIWTELLSTKKFIHFGRVRKVLDIDYLIDTVFKIQEPLDKDSISKSSISYLISVTDMTNGKVAYLSNKNSDFDVYESMRATMAFPIFYKESVTIGDKKYGDGLFSASAYFHIAKARELGAEKIYVIDSGIRTSKILYRIYLLFKNKEFRRRHNEYMKIKYDLDGIILIKPQKLKGGILDNRKKILEGLISEGRKLGE